MSLRNWKGHTYFYKKCVSISILILFICQYSVETLHFCVFCYLQRYVADIGKTWAVLIVCGGILPLFLSVIWLLMIRHFVAAMTWITVILFNALIISVTVFFYTKGDKTFLPCFLMSAYVNNVAVLSWYPYCIHELLLSYSWMSWESFSVYIGGLICYLKYWILHFIMICFSLKESNKEPR